MSWMSWWLPSIPNLVLPLRRRVNRRLGHLRVQHASLTLRVGQFKRQVEVLTHLLNILERRRAAVQQRLLAPRQPRVDYHLRLPFPTPDKHP